ncbi:hypothetical protein [Peribacillus loiseleuriae]|uniref:Uncharacterized protein n=1 Tax=Peribacillus loiseleuriae TaxID=1679170 RepID=A0A0K9GV19_9BACI|nr:hypothetical protein [Peribacillus loiseleuriae]KMY50534.1 hypothetical protein AC625_14320 [Peribacillus loiseleuriae]
MERIQAKIHVTKDYIYVFGDLTKKPVKIENRINHEHFLIGEAFRKYEEENFITLRGKRKSHKKPVWK